ncbi:MAG TPA: hypothetical protein VMU51_20815 [Mycobacteriales bacterium]|nr:hypothetical protein [Mycobacteriales bacterium]
MARAAILARAQWWLDRPRPYSQQDCDPVSGYRLDCSGYVSMAWQLAPPGLTTVEPPDECVPISDEELAAGDALMLGGPGTGGDAGHVLLFDRWAGAGGLWAYEHTGGGSKHHVLGRPGPEFLPYRFRAVAELLDPKG